MVSCKGIAEGIENSNYLLQTDDQSYILTLYEKRVAPEDLPFFLGLMDHLAARGIDCPVPIRASDGEALRELCGRPAALVSFLKGMWPRRVTAEHCAALGRAMAEMHVAGADFTMSRTLSTKPWTRWAQPWPMRAMVAATSATPKTSFIKLARRSSGRS